MSKRDKLYDDAEIESRDTITDHIGDGMCDAHPGVHWVRIYRGPGERTIRACAECVDFLGDHWVN